MLFSVIHYNTPKLTSALVDSIFKLHPDAEIIVFDNSDSRPISCDKWHGVRYFDNTEGGIINFHDELAKFPRRNEAMEIRVGTSFGSAKHSMSVQWIMNNIGRPFVLIDSDALLKKAVDFDDDRFAVAADIEIGEFKIRALPLIMYLNVPRLKDLYIDFFDPRRMIALSDDRYDTGASLFEDIHQVPNGLNRISFASYIFHYGSASWPINNTTANDERIDRWLERYRYLYVI